MKLGRKAILSIVGVVVGIGFLYFLATSVVPRMLVTLTKAAPATKVSFGNSILIGKKILAAADGKEECLVNVFVMDENGRGVAGKVVEVAAVAKSGSGKATVAMAEELSDKEGNVMAEIVSKDEGQYTVTATIEGVELARNLVVTFRN